MELAGAWLALAGTLFGGAGFKVIEFIITRGERRDTTATTLRTELRTELTNLRAEAAGLRKEQEELRDEIDEWRTKYFHLVSTIASGDLNASLRLINERRDHD